MGGNSEDGFTYKIVDSTGNIAGYGQGDNMNLTINSNDLPDDENTVYIWAQQDNDIHSHAGSMPEYFTMTVQTDNSGSTGSGVPPTNPKTGDCGLLLWSMLLGSLGGAIIVWRSIKTSKEN